MSTLSPSSYIDEIVPAFLNPDGVTVTPVSAANPLPVTGGGGGGGGGAVTVADGADITLGAKADAAWTTGPGSLVAVSKAIVGAINAPLPAGTNAIGTVLVPETTFYNETTTALGASASFTGTTRDSGVAAGTATAVTYFNAYFFADQTGTAYIDCSNDASTWRPIATVALTASTGAILTAPVMTRYHRARLVNGTTAQTVCMVNSSYTGA